MRMRLINQYFINQYHYFLIFSASGIIFVLYIINELYLIITLIFGLPAIHHVNKFSVNKSYKINIPAITLLLGQHKRHPEFPVVTRESRRNSRKTT